MVIFLIHACPFFSFVSSTSFFLSFCSCTQAVVRSNWTLWSPCRCPVQWAAGTVQGQWTREWKTHGFPWARTPSAFRSSIGAQATPTENTVIPVKKQLVYGQDFITIVYFVNALLIFCALEIKYYLELLNVQTQGPPPTPLPPQGPSLQK